MEKRKAKRKDQTPAHGNIFYLVGICSRRVCLERERKRKLQQENDGMNKGSQRPTFIFFYKMERGR
jgi:hypothetical protein